jgi:drug/metabolite transporter (DMT)-like permease
MTDGDTHRPAGFRPHLALVAVQLFFGTWPLFGKVVLRDLPSAGLASLRICGAALCLYALRRTLGRLPPAPRADYLRLALYSLLGVVLNQFLFVKGLSLSTVINANLLGTMIPVSALVVGVLAGRERFSARVAAGVLVAASGAAFLVNPLGADFSRETVLGNALLLTNAVCYGTYLVLTQDIIRRYDPLTVITWVFMLASLVALPVGVYSLRELPPTALAPGLWLRVLYIVLVPTVGAYYLNAWALGRVAPSVVAVYVYLQPLIALALAPVVLGETVLPRTWAAAALIFAGVALVTVRRPSRVIEEVSERPDAPGR